MRKKIQFLQLEEIKTKERLIGQLKKEIETIKGSPIKKRNAQNGSDVSEVFFYKL